MLANVKCVQVLYESYERYKLAYDVYLMTFLSNVCTS
jgi:hypothetical protein